MENNLNTDLTDAKRSTEIRPSDVPKPIELSEFISLADKYFESGPAIEYMAYNEGKNKNAHTAFKPSLFLRSINLILYNMLRDNHKSNSHLLKAYFEGMNQQLKMLDSMNLRLDEKRFICNIIGYTINCFKNNTFKK